MKISILLIALALFSLALVVYASSEDYQSEESLQDTLSELAIDAAKKGKGAKKHGTKPKKGAGATQKKKKPTHAGFSGQKVCSSQPCCGQSNLAFQWAPNLQDKEDCHIAAQHYCGAKNKCCNKIMFGIDSNDPGIFNHAGPIKASGARFVVRYVSHQLTSQFDTTPVTPAEASHWRSVGMPLVAVFEINRTRAVDGRTKKKNFANGVIDARNAKALMAKIGGAKKPVYFAVDAFVDPVHFSSLPADVRIRSVDAVVPYFLGIRKVMGPERTGAYGSYTLIKGLFDRNLIKYGWQASSFDSKGRLDPRAQLYQCNIMPPNTYGSAQVDYDLALAKDFGQWR